MCGRKNIQHNSLEPIVERNVQISLSLKHKYHHIARFVCGFLPRDNNWSIYGAYINEITHIIYINHTDWTVQDESLKLNLFYPDKLHLIEEGNAKLAVSVYNFNNPNAIKISKIVSVSSKLFACNTGFNLKQEDFLNVFVFNSVCNPDKSIAKYVRKSINKSFSTSSVLSVKPNSDSNDHASKLVSASSVHPSKPIHGSNARSIKSVGVTSICPSKQTYGSNVRPSKTFSAINAHADKFVFYGNVCSRKSVSAGYVCPSKTISGSNVRSSNSTSAINVQPKNSVSASNICSGKPVCKNNVRSSKPTCRRNVCESQPTIANIVPCKPVPTKHIYRGNLSISSHQFFFIFLLSILIFSVDYKFIIITMNIFSNLLLVIVILLPKLTCSGEFFRLFISWNSRFLRSSFVTYITFQSCWALLLPKNQRFLFFTNSICVFAMLSIIVLNFSTSNVQANCSKCISQKFGKRLNSLFGRLTHFEFMYFYL